MLGSTVLAGRFLGTHGFSIGERKSERGGVLGWCLSSILFLSNVKRIPWTTPERSSNFLLEASTFLVSSEIFLLWMATLD